MAVRDHILRAFIVVGVFSLAAIFLFPWLTNEHAERRTQPVELSDPAQKGDHDSTHSGAITSGPGTGNDAGAPGHKIHQPPPSNFAAGKSVTEFAIASPNGRYRFALEKSGGLALTDLLTNTELFFADTEYYWPVDWHVELAEDGVLKLSWTNETQAPNRGTPWVSSMLLDCAPMVRGTGGGQLPELQLFDNGMLRIRAGRDTVCLLHRSVEDKGRLAIVYGGLLRTYLKTCDDHRAKFVDAWAGSGGVDVHVLAYFEDVVHPSGDKVTAASVRAHLDKCFGSALKTVELYRLSEIEETAMDAPDLLLQKCPQPKLDHQLSQLKSLSLAAEQVQRYMIEKGVSYDYIFKSRLDLQLWGTIPPLSSLQVPQNGIIAPRVYYDWTWYSLLHDGELRAGVTDIAAFGRTSHMFTYLNLYKEFIRLRSTEKERAKWKAVNAKQRDRTLENKEHCTPEGILAYWLAINDIAVKTDWRFQMGLLRKNGDLIFTCPAKNRHWLCPGL